MPTSNDGAADFPARVRAALTEQGFSEEDLEHVVLSPTEIEQPEASVAPPARRVLSREEVAAEPNLPPIPQPTGPNDLPPAQSASIIVSTNGIALFVNVNGFGYLPVANPQLGPFSPPFPNPANIAFKRYWLNVGTYVIVGPQAFSQAISSTVGMEVSDSTTLSAELGVQVDGLSAKVTASTTHTVSITNSQTSQQTYNLPEVPAGSTCVYTLWQLVEQFALVDGNNNPIAWSGMMIYLWEVPANFPQNVFANNTATYASSPVIFPSA